MLLSVVVVVDAPRLLNTVLYYTRLGPELIAGHVSKTGGLDMAFTLQILIYSKSRPRTLSLRKWQVLGVFQKYLSIGQGLEACLFGPRCTSTVLRYVLAMRVPSGLVCSLSKTPLPSTRHWTI